MEITACAYDFAHWIGEVLQLRVEKSETDFNFLTPKSKKSSKLTSGEIDTLIMHLRTKEEKDCTAIYDKCSYEVIIRQTSPFPFIGASSINRSDELNGITYTLSPASDEYFLFLLYKVSKVASIRDLSPASVLMLHRELEDQSVLTLLRKAFPRLLTLTIKSRQNRSVDKLVEYAMAFLFELGYNLDAAFIAPKHFDDLLRTGRLRKQDRRAEPKDILPPRRSYNQDLTHYYQLALATEVPSLEYLSYYHIIEYFGESIFVADLVERVRQTITEAGFSYRRDRDIKRLIKMVEELPRTRPNSTRDASRDELALRMTLERYVKVPDLLTRLRNYDNTLVGYYKNTSVPFVNKAIAVDLEGSDFSQVLAHLARRIYRTRNAIVHSKEAAQSRYTPFKHDRDLTKEIPLLRFVAELIILGTSNIIS